MAASTCNHKPCSAQISAMSSTGSKARDDVVPVVALTKNGMSPACLSALIFFASSSVRNEYRSSTFIVWRFSDPIPATIQAFSMDEWASVEAYATNRLLLPLWLVRLPVALSRAASSAQSVALEAESSITPPPLELDENFSGNPSNCTSQSITCDSSSVQAGDVIHNMPCTPRPADNNSPRIDGAEVFAGK